MIPSHSAFTPELLDAAVELMGRSGRGGTVRVQGRSMVPTLAEGCLLAVEFSPTRLHRGDLLVFRCQAQLVVHRLLGRGRSRGGKEMLRTRGDGSPYFDPPVDRTAVVARVVAVHDGRDWRTVRSPLARGYGRLLAWHDLFWALVTVGSRLGARALARLKIEAPLTSWTATCDRGLLRAVHAVAFRAAHRRIPPPSEATG